MSKKLLHPASILVIAIALVTGLLFLNRANSAAGKVSDYAAPCNTADATSTLAFLRPGVGTTTLTCPIGARDRLQDNSAILHFNVTATTTGVATPSLVVRVEASRDNIDWYPIAVPTQISGTVATTTLFTTNPYNNMLFSISTSTTPAGDFGGTGTGTVIKYSLTIPAPEPFVRVIFSSPTNGGIVGLWAEMYGKLPL